MLLEKTEYSGMMEFDLVRKKKVLISWLPMNNVLTTGDKLGL
jgi:hypothetical protein